tara:strand:- start:41 stop:229 length:189 start_codon:yes stop_codon:yes gene_type:complete
MALGQKYYISIGDGRTSMYFWAQNDAEALNLVKHHKFTITQKTELTNCSAKRQVKLDTTNED